jgi:hypothetical protein
MKGKIYKLTSPNTDMIYIGSTTQKLADRLKGHRNDALNPNRVKASSSIMFDYRDVSIHLIRECECDNIKIEEQIEMDKYDGKICNHSRAYTSPEMKKEKGKIYRKNYIITDSRKEYQKEYKKKEKYKNQQKEYRKEYIKTEAYKNNQVKYNNMDYKKKYKQTDKYKLSHQRYGYWIRSEFGLLCKMAIIYDI